MQLETYLPEFTLRLGPLFQGEGTYLKKARRKNLLPFNLDRLDSKAECIYLDQIDVLIARRPI